MWAIRAMSSKGILYFNMNNRVTGLLSKKGKSMRSQRVEDEWNS